QKEKKNKQNVPSFAHVALITHLFGDVHYVWRKCAKDDKDLIQGTASQNLQSAPDPQTQTEVAQCSAYSYTYNKMIDYTLKKPVNDQPDEQESQDQIIGIHTKAVFIIPRLCILFQIFSYAMDVLKKCENGVVFDEGYLASRKINESLIRNAIMLVNQILASAPRSPYCPKMRMLFVEKPACIAACNYYDHLHNTAVTLFRLSKPPKYEHTPQKSLSRSKLIRPLSSVNVPSTLERAICLFPYNFFMYDTLVTRMAEQWEIQNSMFHNSGHLVKQALTNFINAGIFISGGFLVDSNNILRKSIMKVPVSHDQQKRDEFGTKLKKYDIKLSDYEALYKVCAKPARCRLSHEVVYYYSQFADFVPEYSKYKTDMKETIEQLVKDGHITEIIVNNDIQYAVTSTSTHFRSLPINRATYEQLKKEQTSSLEQIRSAKSSRSQSGDTKIGLPQSSATPTPSQSMSIMTTATISSSLSSQQPSRASLQFLHQFFSSLSETRTDMKGSLEITMQSNTNQHTECPNSFNVQPIQNQTSDNIQDRVEFGQIVKILVDFDNSCGFRTLSKALVEVGQFV
ncbi:unnamed protein product, partial [Didymodactylos carnosus]